MSGTNMNQLRDEAREISAAADRLLAGKPRRSNGKLTASALAVEAGLSRQRIYEHHRETLADFKIRAGGGPLIPNQQALQQRLHDAEIKIKTLESAERLLKDQIVALTATVVELTHETQAENVVKMPPRRPRRR